jgi:hypothetical protein
VNFRTFLRLVGPPETQKETPKPKTVEVSPKHKARSSGQTEEMPDASDAAKLFNDALDELRETVKIL